MTVLSVADTVPARAAEKLVRLELPAVCQNSHQVVEKRLQRIQGVAQATVDENRKTVRVRFDDEQIDRAVLTHALDRMIPERAGSTAPV